MEVAIKAVDILKENPEYAAFFREVQRPATTGNGKGAGSPSPQRVAAEAGAGVTRQLDLVMQG